MPDSNKNCKKFRVLGGSLAGTRVTDGKHRALLKATPVQRGDGAEGAKIE